MILRRILNFRRIWFLFSTNNLNFRRTLFLSFVPEEEVAGYLGMKLFSESAEFRALNIGVALDEGLARNEDKMTVFYGERHVFWPTVSNSLD